MTITSLLRQRIGYRTWRAVHWLTYASWPIALLHGLGTGSDVKATWLLALSVALPARRARRGPRARAVAAGPPHLRARARGARRRRRRSRCSWCCGCRAGRSARNGRAARARRPRCSATATPRRLDCERRSDERALPAMTEAARADQRAAAPRTLPRLLAGSPRAGAMTSQSTSPCTARCRASGRGRRRARDACRAPDRARSSAPGLRGRGGAAFPTATKMRAVAASRGRAIVVVNAAEGEPASLKDRTLLELLPHLVLDGAVLAAEAVGADEVIVCRLRVAGGEPRQRRRRDRRTRRRSGRSGSSSRLTMAVVPGHYVAGQESALVNHLNGGPAKPTVHAADALRAGRPAAPHARQQRRDAGPRRADRPPRSRAGSASSAPPASPARRS